MRKGWFLVLLIGLVLIVGCTSEVTQDKKESSSTTPATANTEPATETASVISATQHQVVIEGFKFMPADVEVKVGDTIEWVNKDSQAHTVTIAALGVDENLPAGGTASVTLTKKGSFAYRCSFHPSMQGRVIVN
jgi:plastocyanin